MALKMATLEEIKFLCALGFDRVSKKVMSFPFTKGTGHTEPGEPCAARWKDKNSNATTGHVPCPKVCARHFANSKTH